MIISLIESGALAIVGYFILIYLSVNLLGLFVRGLFTNPTLDNLEKEGSDFIKQEVAKSRRAEVLTNITAVALLAIYFYLLFHFLNAIAVVASLMIMVARTPDLIWEIKHGRKIDVQKMKRNWLFYTTSLLICSAFFVLWYALYTAYFL